MQCLGSSGGWWVTYFADPSKVCPPHQHPLLRGLNLSMLRAARRAAADHVRILLQQLLFFYRVKLTAIQLQFQLEEAMDDLENLSWMDSSFLAFYMPLLWSYAVSCQMRSG